ncbi:hypothetical protein phytr_2360 [Candidatus Phycorickettsia trachydisci]|uniref:SPOR domain-containing protein n=1 Tax=Candidatus Phycorickettsia trachydisci TaxID=2115978 RepID=A0A2P1P7F0_9RICK|nr:hypothetical protein [Candidatus Phycorickettsia trachydisci]AVP87193.1 hypothetical protein phytr_2360 [Candidatus Phycorickettsia trachydisci]
MKIIKAAFLMLLLILVASGIFFYNKNASPIIIFYDGQSRKAKNVPSKMTKLNLSVYENLSDINNNNKISTKILDQEKPLDLNLESNSIVEDVINEFIEKSEVIDYEGIKVTSYPETQIYKIRKPKSHSLYNLDLGYYVIEEKSNQVFRHMVSIEPSLEKYTKSVKIENFKDRALYHMTLSNLPNFNTAINICRKLSHAGQDCVVMNGAR